MSLNCEVYVLVSGGGLRSCLLIVDCVIPARVINHNKNFICFGQMVQKFKVIFAVLCNCAVYYNWTHRQKVTALLYSIVSPKLSSHNKTVVIIVITRKEIEVKFVKNWALIYREDINLVAYRCDIRINILVVSTWAN